MSRQQLRPELQGICPARMNARPLDERGYSIPFFVGYIDGKPDFRCIDPEKFIACIRFKKCWLCGEKLGKRQTFVIGPMCVINRVTSEPPCHIECATYAVKGCPFLKHPNTKYREANLPAGHKEPAGIGLKHNPTASALYTCEDWRCVKVENGYLIRLGEPTSLQFWHRGEIATRRQVIDAMQIGLPKLVEIARMEGQEAYEELSVKVEAAEFYLPTGPERLEMPA